MDGITAAEKILQELVPCQRKLTAFSQTEPAERARDAGLSKPFNR